MREQDTTQNSKRPLILALVGVLISTTGAIGLLLSLWQMNPINDPNNGAVIITLLILLGIMIVGTVTVRFFQTAEKLSLDDE